MKKEIVYEIIYKCELGYGIYQNATGISFKNENSAKDFCEKYNKDKIGGYHTYQEKIRTTYDSLEDYERVEQRKRNNVMKAHADMGKKRREQLNENDKEME